MDKRVELELRGLAPDQMITFLKAKQLSLYRRFGTPFLSAAQEMLKPCGDCHYSSPVLLDLLKDLNLDNCRASQIAGITNDFVNLKRLSMSNVGLQTLKGLPHLPNLQRLDLSDNKLTGSLEHLLSAEQLTHLNLSGNKISNMDCLEPLRKLEHLKFLDMFNCDVTKTEAYRSKVLDMLPSLVYLDGCDREDREYVSDDDDDNPREAYDEEDCTTDEDEEAEEYGLAYLQSSKAAQDDDEEDFEPGESGDDEDDDELDDEDEDEEDQASTENRGKKRKLDADPSD